MNPNTYPLDPARSKLARDLLDRLDKLGDNFSDLRRLYDAAVQQTDAPAGSLTTRTDAAGGVVTLAAGGLAPAPGALADLSWAGGSRTRVAVTAVAGLAVTVAGGTGSDLPAQGTAATLAHYTTVADAFRFVATFQPSAGTPADPAVAFLAFKELDSFLNTSAALLQACARFKQ